MKVLLTSSSFYETPGKHHKLLDSTSFEVDYIKGPLEEKELLPIISQYDAVICGDDEYSHRVLEKGAQGKLKYISKYGVGLDKIDLSAASKLEIPVRNCPGINQNSVAEHVIALIMCYEKNIHLHYNATQSRQWVRLTGNEIRGKIIGIIGLGSIGKEVVKKTIALGMRVKAFDITRDDEFLKQHRELEFVKDLDEIFKSAEIISLHLPHTPSTEGLINREVINGKIKNNPVIINTSRGKLVDPEAILEGIDNGLIRAYLTDVLESEPMTKSEVLAGQENVIITPHVGSRTIQNVENQGTMAIRNLLELINGED